MYVYVYTYIYLSLSLYIYIYMYTLAARGDPSAVREQQPCPRPAVRERFVDKVF